MFIFTKEERRVILFLAAVSLVGLGVNFLLKTNLPVKGAITVSEDIGKINLNQASLDEILKARCLSRKVASSIIEYRSLNGEFEKMEDLMRVKGIGEYRYEKLKEWFFVE